MFCKSCGAGIDPNIKFCQSCGAKVENPNEQSDSGYSGGHSSNPNSGNRTYYQGQPNIVYMQNKPMPVTIGGWIGRSLIPFIPLVGGIIYLIMLFIWSGDMTKEETFRNWAKAQLIVMAIVLGIFLLVFIILLASGAALFAGSSSYYY